MHIMDALRNMEIKMATFFQNIGLMETVVVIGIASAGLLALYARGVLQDKVQDRRLPLNNLRMLRPPGTRLWNQIRAYDKESWFHFLRYFLFTLLLSVVIWLWLVFFRAQALTGPAAWLVLAALVLVFGGLVRWSMVAAIQALLNMSQYHKGYKGEMLVGSELNQLMLRGYRVFHDLTPLDWKGNIDHLLIGKNGVFVVETKARTGHVSERGPANYKGEYDGRAIRLSGSGAYTDAVDQVKNNVARVRQWLTRYRKGLSVRGILVYPGWDIDFSKAMRVVRSDTPYVVALEELQRRIPVLARQPETEALTDAEISALAEKIKRGAQIKVGKMYRLD